jgi:CDP-diglyceride synthetase
MKVMTFTLQARLICQFIASICSWAMEIRGLSLALLLFFLGWLSDFPHAFSGQVANHPERFEDLCIQLLRASLCTASTSRYL